jgi:hypothetical protein
MKILLRLRQARQDARDRKAQERTKARIAEIIQRQAITALIEKEYPNREHRTCAGYRMIPVKRKEV